MNVLIVDDEPLAIDVMETYIDKIPELNIIGKCTNALEANEIIRKENVDLLFLDIQMPQITGIDFLKSLSNPPMVIFTTAYSNYALEGFELNALDYLLKPISLDRFMKAVNKAMEQYELTHQQGGATSDGSSTTEDFFFVKADKKLVKVRHDDILYIEGLKDYVIIRLKVGRVITLQTMKSLEEKLPSHLFKRIHRSYIVALDKINALVGNMVELTEKGQSKTLPVGKNYRDELLKLVNKKRL